MSKKFFPYVRACLLLAVCVSLSFLAACEKRQTGPEEVPVLVASPSTIQVGEVTTFTVKSGDRDVTAEAVITEVSSGVTVRNASWVAQTSGSYTFEAVWHEMTSKRISVTVLDAEPIEEECELTFAPQDVASEIGVFAYDTGAEVLDESARPNFLFNQKVSAVGAYEPVMLWPDESETHLSFMAYAPYATGENRIMITTDENTSGAPMLKYTLSPTDSHRDILLATAMDRMRDKEPVALKFHSLMSKIGFKIKGQGETVTKIAVRGIQVEGEIALNTVLSKEEISPWKLNAEHSMDEYELILTDPDGVVATGEMTNVTAEAGYLYIFPQNIFYTARIVVTVDGKELGFPFDGLAQFRAGEEYLIEIDIPGDKPLDYTDNAMASFLLAPTDVASADNVSYADATAECEAAGYRLPTYNEGLQILFFMNGIEGHNYRGATYWTSTMSREAGVGDGNAMGYNIVPWLATYMPIEGVTAGRCVRSAPQGKHYPYVDTSDPEGPIIVCRDADGGVSPSAWQDFYGAEMAVFHEFWETTPDHDYQSGYDRLSPKMQVANFDAAEGEIPFADWVCPEGWRKPTMQELAFIYSVGGAEKASYGADNVPAVDTPLYSVEGFTPFKPAHYWAASMSAGRGGRNPSSWSFAITGRNGLGNSVNGSYVRCVRDVE